MLTKAELVDNAGGSVRFQFNPETIQFKSAAHVSGQAATRKAQYIGPAAIDLQLKMLLDEVTGDESVLARLETMMQWTRPRDEQNNSYEVTFNWGLLKVGSSVGLTCHCVSIDVAYQLFTPQGVPVRAMVTISLKEILPEQPAGQNPTSGGEQPARSHTLRSGEDLAVLSHAEYGTTSKWRDLAERNGIDNPFRLPIGTEMIFPARLELER
jgi:hypothetical protein